MAWTTLTSLSRLLLRLCAETARCRAASQARCLAEEAADREARGDRSQSRQHRDHRGDADDAVEAEREPPEQEPELGARLVGHDRAGRTGNEEEEQHRPEPADDPAPEP